MMVQELTPLISLKNGKNMLQKSKKKKQTLAMRKNWFFSLFQFAKIFLRPGPFKIALKYFINIFRNAKNIFEYLSLLAKKILRNSHYILIIIF